VWREWVNADDRDSMELKMSRVKRESKMKIRPTVMSVTPCNLVEVYQGFGGMCSLYLLHEDRSSITSVTCYTRLLCVTAKKSLYSATMRTSSLT
jgi:hypothetical protein